MIQNKHFSPYKGLKPFTEEDTEYFFGRKVVEKIIINNLLLARLTLLYGESGAGKSSILRAGVASALLEQAHQKLNNSQRPDYTVVIFNDWQVDPVEGILKEVKNAITKLYASYNLTLPPVTGNLSETLATWTEAAAISGKLLIILDQFEEYFLYHPQARDNFTRQFPQAVNKTNLNVNFLISIRDDQLFKLNRFKGQLPTLFENCIRIDSLNREAARRAIIEPIYYFRVGIGESPYSIESELVERILDELETPRGNTGSSLIEPAYLQMVMGRLWEEVNKDGLRELKLATLEKLNGVEEIVRTHRDKVLANLSPVELSVATDIIQYLNASRVSYSAKELTKFANQTDINRVLEKLSSREIRLLKPIQDPFGKGEIHYQLFNRGLEWGTERVSGHKLMAPEKTNQLRISRVVMMGGLALLALLLIVALAIYATVSANDANEQRSNAQKAQATASGRLTEVSAAAAQESEKGRKAAEVQALLLQAKTTDDPELALSLTLEAYQRLPDSNNESALRNAIENSRLRAVIKNQTGIVVQLQWSQDGKRILTASEDGTARIWNAQTGAELVVMRGHSGPLTGATFSPDQSRVLTTAADNARIWDAASGKELLALQGHTGGITVGAWSPDGTRVATSSLDHTASVWDALSGQQITLFDKHKDIIHSIGWDKAGQRLLTGSNDRSARIWKADNGQEEYVYNGPALHTSWLDSDLILVGGIGAARTIDITGGNLGQVFEQGSGGDVLAIRNPGPSFALLLTYSGVPDGTGAKIWDSKGQLKFTIPDFKNIATAEWSPDGKFILLTSQKEGLAGVYSGSDGSQLSLLRGHKGGLTGALAWSPDSGQVVTAGKDLTVRVWEPLLFAASPSKRTSLENYLKYSPDQKKVLLNCNFGNSSKKLIVWDTTSLKTNLEKDKIDCFRQIDWSPDGKYLLASRSGSVPSQVLDASTGQILYNLPSAPCTNCYGSWSPNGKYIVVHGNSNDGFALIADASTGKAITSPPQYLEFAVEPTWSADNYLVLNQKDGLLVVDPATGQPRLSLKKEQSRGWSTSGKLLLTYEPVAKITRVRNWPEGNEILALQGEEGLALSPDGQYLVTHNEANYYLREAATGKQLVKYLGPNTASSISVSFSSDSMYWLSGTTPLGQSGLNINILSVKTGQEVANLQDVSQFKWNPTVAKLEYLSFGTINRAFILDFTLPQPVPIGLSQSTVILDSIWAPDGKSLFVLGADYTLRKVLADNTELLALARSRLFTQNLTPEQLKKYLQPATS